MNMIIVILSLLLSGVAFGQTRPEFEVASIRPVSEQVAQIEVGLTINGAQARFTSLSLKDYIAMAYDLKLHQISGPDWLSTERFNIAAKFPEGAKPEQVGEMLQSLLTERFRMKTHRDKKEFPVYALEVAKSGLKMKESASASDITNTDRGGLNIAAGGSGAGGGVNLGNGSSFAFANNKFEGKKLTMPGLTDMLSRFVDRPVIDMTNLKGGYDFVLELSPEDYRVMLIRSAISAGIVLPPQALRLLDGGSVDSLSGALEKYGLTLAARREPLDVVVIDSMQKVPTEN